MADNPAPDDATKQEEQDEQPATVLIDLAAFDEDNLADATIARFAPARTSPA